MWREKSKYKAPPGWVRRGLAAEDEPAYRGLAIYCARVCGFYHAGVTLRRQQHTSMTWVIKGDKRDVNVRVQHGKTSRSFVCQATPLPSCWKVF